MNALERRVRDTWLKVANVPSKGRSLDDLDVPEMALDWVKTYCSVSGTASLEGAGLVLYGPPGHGKTTIAKALVRHVIEHAPLDTLGFTPELKVVTPVFYTAYFDHVEAQKKLWQLERQKQYESGEYAAVADRLDGVLGATYHPEYVYRLVVLDDVGKEYHSGTGWAEGNLNALFRTRHGRGLPTIVTTNIPPTLWGEVYGPAAGSFMREAFWAAEVVSPDGRDRRG